MQPVCIYFADRNTGQFSTVASYVGDDWLLTAVWRTLRSNSVSVTVCFGVPQYAQGRDRRAWAADLRAAVLALRPDSAAVGRGD